jgi:hypothetical protein
MTLDATACNGLANEKTWTKSAPLLAAKFVLRPFGPAAVVLSDTLKLYTAVPGPDVNWALEAKAICLILIGPEKALPA